MQGSNRGRFPVVEGKWRGGNDLDMRLVIASAKPPIHSPKSITTMRCFRATL